MLKNTEFNINIIIQKDKNICLEICNLFSWLLWPHFPINRGMLTRVVSNKDETHKKDIDSIKAYLYLITCFWAAFKQSSVYLCRSFYSPGSYWMFLKKILPDGFSKCINLFRIVITRISGETFHFPFPYFFIFVLWYFPFHVVSLIYLDLYIHTHTHTGILIIFPRRDSSWGSASHR